jgi:hypothetical protein
MAGRFPQQYFDRKEREQLLTADTLIQGTGQSEEPAFDADTKPDTAEREFLSRLEFESWLPFAAKTYRISPHIEDYILKPMPICPSDFPNRNGIGFPLQELVAFQPPPMNRQVYQAWTGCPIHLEHDNEDWTKAYGVMFDTNLTKITNFGLGKHWKVMGLVGVDKNKYPDIAKEVLDGKIITGSMGALADRFSCSVCGREAQENKFMNCNHVGSTKEVNWKLVDYMGKQRIAYLNAHGLSPIEYSLVRDPAWVSAMSDHILAW